MVDVTMQEKPLHLVADDYGLSPGVDKAIRSLLSEGKISGTSCMTLFPEWPDAAALLMPVIEKSGAEIGLHLTLTDFMPLSSVRVMCSMRKRIAQWILGSIDKGKLHRELDAQLNAFIDVVGRVPDYIDGHQHVHFFPVVRDWLIARRDLLISPRGTGPWLRGAPDAGLASSIALRGKISIVERIASGFTSEMEAAGYRVRGPLMGFYDWRKPETFPAALQHFKENAPEGAIVMCHPGHGDALLAARDSLVDAREVEFAELMRQ
ncbi:ChbG/HpnK family deacetylase [Rhizobium oryziradicis]|nr:ChbG/HpnK family deacetylase [Rhizobium oryziradicis]